MSSLSHTTSLRTPRAVSFIAATFSMLALGRSRTALSQLEDRALADIGLTQAQARREASRPIWDVPANWLK